VCVCVCGWVCACVGVCVWVCGCEWVCVWGGGGRGGYVLCEPGCSCVQSTIKTTNRNKQTNRTEQTNKQNYISTYLSASELNVAVLSRPYAAGRGDGTDPFALLAPKCHLPKCAVVYLRRWGMR
jgi:hypothetical protein